MKRNILLALSTSRYSEHLVAHTMDEAEAFRTVGDDVHIDVLYVFERSEIDRVQSVVGEEGFLGIAPKGDVVRLLGAEHHRTAQMRIDDVKKAAADAGFSIDYIEIDGAFSDTVHAQAEKVSYDIILITRSNRPFISRLLFGGESDKVARWAREEGLQVIIDEEG